VDNGCCKGPSRPYLTNSTILIWDKREVNWGWAMVLVSILLKHSRVDVKSVLHAEVACLFVLYVWGSLGMHMSLRLEHISDPSPS